MSVTTLDRAASPRPMSREEKKVILASSLGTTFEWYDFYLYGALAKIIGAQFFSAFPKTTADIFALLAFAAGFLVRPFGALVFGRLGDLVGRKYTFLITILIMGTSTFVVGLLPGYNSIGVAAPIILVAARMLQGLAVGGEYGGAAIYVAEHAPPGRRGFYTSWIQTTATAGLLMSLLVILATRGATGEATFAAWGWRIPFLVSVLLLAVSLWIRLQLNESPAFAKMKAEGATSRAPLTEAFGNWKNARVALIALFGMQMGQAVTFYTASFYALFFLQSILMVDGYTTNLLIVYALVITCGFFVAFGWLSDKIGRKPIMMAGCLIAAFAYFPIFKMMTERANPALARAQANVTVTVTADPADCGSLFNPVGTRVFTSSCDIARAALTKSSVHYTTLPGPAGQPATIKIAGTEIAAFDNKGVPDAKAAQGGVLERPGRRSRRGGLPDGQGPRDRQDGRPVRRRSSAGPVDHRPAVRPEPAGDDGLRPDRGGARRAVPDPHPVFRHVAALPHRQWLVRRPLAGDRVHDRRLDWEYPGRALVPGGHRRRLLRDRARRPARDLQARHHGVTRGRATSGAEEAAGPVALEDRLRGRPVLVGGGRGLRAGPSAERVLCGPVVAAQPGRGQLMSILARGGRRHVHFSRLIKSLWMI